MDCIIQRQIWNDINPLSAGDIERHRDHQQTLTSRPGSASVSVGCSPGLRLTVAEHSPARVHEHGLGGVEDGPAGAERPLGRLLRGHQLVVAAAVQLWQRHQQLAQRAQVGGQLAGARAQLVPDGVQPVAANLVERARQHRLGGQRVPVELPTADTGHTACQTPHGPIRNNTTLLEYITYILRCKCLSASTRLVLVDQTWWLQRIPLHQMSQKTPTLCAPVCS